MEREAVSYALVINFFTAVASLWVPLYGFWGALGVLSHHSPSKSARRCYGFCILNEDLGLVALNDLPGFQLLKDGGLLPAALFPSVGSSFGFCDSARLLEGRGSSLCSGALQWSPL